MTKCRLLKNTAIEYLRGLPEFKKLLSKQPKQDRENFTKFMQQMNSAHQFIKGIRDAIGGHVLHQSTSKALDTLSFEWEGLLEAGEIVEDTHYRFAGELVLAILLPEVPADERMKKLESIIKTAASLTPAIGIVDSLVLMYLRDRRLI